MLLHLINELMNQNHYGNKLTTPLNFTRRKRAIMFMLLIVMNNVEPKNIASTNT